VTDGARRLVVERGLVRAAFEHLTTDAFVALPFEALGPTKALLKRFFSLERWTDADDDALAAAVGAGEGWWERSLDEDLTLAFGWQGGRFGVRVASAGPDPAPASAHALAGTFDGPVVPEATPNPRTIRFQVGAIHSGPSRWYESATAAADDPGAARLFAEFEQVANVLAGPDFVAVGLRRPSDWEHLLAPVLAVVTEEFAPEEAEEFEPRTMGGPAGAGVAGGASSATASGGRRVSRLEQAWNDLGSLRPADPADLAEVRAAAAGDEAARRQVAASLLREADPQVALAIWSRLVNDKVRSVRRAAVDAMVDVGRQEVRPLLEGALDDADAWVRWKALRGLSELGAQPSRDAISARADDGDFRVRLEAAAALRSILEMD
jgi:hypothetical protein